MYDVFVEVVVWETFQFTVRVPTW